MYEKVLVSEGYCVIGLLCNMVIMSEGYCMKGLLCQRVIV